MRRATADDYRPAPDDSGLPLFAAAAAARAADPPTSHQAAREMSADEVARHERAILGALAAGPAGKTAIAARLAGALSDQQVIRRMARLERAGLVVRCGDGARSSAGRAESEYRLP